MAHLWFRDHDDNWSAMPLNADAVDISRNPPRELAGGFRLGDDCGAAVICSRAGDSPVWVLVVAGDGDIFVNGFAPVAGLRVLRDRDELRVGASGTVFFSAETLAHVEEFPGAGRAIFCGRCRQPLRQGEVAVRCPGCGIWHHQADSLPCWTYAPTCAFCPQATALDAALNWIPEA
jgi:hypothetical protein